MIDFRLQNRKIKKGKSIPNTTYFEIPTGTDIKHQKVCGQLQ